MKKIIIGSLIGIGLFLSSCTEDKSIIHVCTTKTESWVHEESGESLPTDEEVQITINTTKEGQAQVIEGFGACFNELGWTSLSLLSEADRNSIMKELFQPDYGACFTVCRMPVGANDFSRDWYSYNEVAGDFEMKHFSIENDKETLIPFIKKARKFQPNLKLWASPWCPPSWMKYNQHYASAYTGEEYNEKYRNGLPKDKVGYEGTDMFIQDSRYMKSYALYFKKFIRSYSEQGIPIFAVMPQNEFNSAQIFPSCCWTAKGLAKFVGQYLGPVMKEEGVDVMFGTMERANTSLIDTLLQDPKAAPYIKGVGFQWAGKEAIGDIHRRYPEQLFLQTEQECGDGKNCWEGMLHSWDLLKHFLENGVSIYDYWNISLQEGGISRWGWAQNSLVVVNTETRTYRYTYEYYLMKHFSHFIKRGAVRLNLSSGTIGNALAFLNTDGSIILLSMEKEGRNKSMIVNINGKQKKVFLKANSLNTWSFK